MRASRLGAARLGSSALVTALVAAVIFWIAYDNGGYGMESRASIAIAVWWTLIVGIVFGLFPREPLGQASLAIGGLLAALTLWTLASLLWTASSEKTFAEFNRVSLYLGVYALVILASSRRNIGRWADGLAVAIAGVAVVALASRLFPGVFQEKDLATFLPSAVTRLSFPLGYWNGLAIFLALGVPLLLRVAVIARSAVVRGLALAPMPVIASAIYLTSSRGGVVSVAVAALVFLALTERRWTASVALAVSLLGSAAAIAVLLDREELVDGPFGTGLVERQGNSAALLIAAICAATGLVYGLGSGLFAGTVRSPNPALGWAVVAIVAALGAASLAAVHPVAWFETFRTPPEELSAPPGDTVNAHLLSATGSGRWQLWVAAVDEWREYPLAGEGAGAYAAWWAEHASRSRSVLDAHSLYLEALGELGVVGFALVAALAVGGIAVGVNRARATADDARVSAAAEAAVFTTFVVAAGFDWVWEVTAVGVVAFVALGVVSGSACTRTRSREPLPSRESRLGRRGRFGLRVVGLVAASVLVCAQGSSLLAGREIGASQAAVRRHDLITALRSAQRARQIQPWSATPYLQLALVSEESGDLRRASAFIERAVKRDSRDWRLWLVSARVNTKLGRTVVAERSLRRAIHLNPRSPLFINLLKENS